VGEKIDDLRDFEPEMFVDALLGMSIIIMYYISIYFMSYSLAFLAE
jgi:hypothetical protein